MLLKKRCDFRSKLVDKTHPGFPSPLQENAHGRLGSIRSRVVDAQTGQVYALIVIGPHVPGGYWRQAALCERSGARQTNLPGTAKHSAAAEVMERPLHRAGAGTLLRLHKKRGAPRSARGPSRGENAPSRPAASWSPTGSTRSTIGARGLNFRVRDGTGCASPAMAAGRLGAFCLRGAAFHRALGAAQRAQASSPPGPPMGRACGGARPISAARLRRSPALHLRPIELVVYEWPYRREISSRDGLPA